MAGNSALLLGCSSALLGSFELFSSLSRALQVCSLAAPRLAPLLSWGLLGCSLVSRAAPFCCFLSAPGLCLVVFGCSSALVGCWLLL